MIQQATCNRLLIERVSGCTPLPLFVLDRHFIRERPGQYETYLGDYVARELNVVAERPGYLELAKFAQ